MRREARVLVALLASLGAAPGLSYAGDVPGLTVTEEANLRLYREYIAAENSGDLTRLADLIHESYRGELNGSPVPGRGPGVEVDTLRSVRAAFPDYTAEVEQVLARGDFVSARWRVTGTHRGNWSGLPPTNRRISFSGCTMLEVREGKVTRGFSYIDTGSILLQLGAVRLLSLVLIISGGALGSLAALLAVYARRRLVRSDGGTAERYGVTGLIVVGAAALFSLLVSLLLALLGRGLPA